VRVPASNDSQSGNGRPPMSEAETVPLGVEQRDLTVVGDARRQRGGSSVICREGQRIAAALGRT
jgi:hypothetical protein